MTSEVEEILIEIRERVRAEEKQREDAPTEQNGHGPIRERGSAASAPLARLDAHLTTTARAWDRLPPVFSNRGGMIARIEVWIKARLKSFARWFTWEQINFNSAAHHGLADAFEALRAHEQRLVEMQAEVDQNRRDLQTELNRAGEAWRREMQNATEALRVEHRRSLAALQAELVETASSLELEQKASEKRLAQTTAALCEELSQSDQAVVAELRQTADSLRRNLAEITADLKASIAARAAEVDTRVTQLAGDLHEEQRVCFKQLSLETSEAAVLEDRGRRAIEARLEKLEQRLAASPRSGHTTPD